MSWIEKIDAAEAGRKMQKKIFLLCTCLFLIGFCVFPGISETELAFPEGQAVEYVGKWKEAYQNLLLEEDVKRMALLYLDEDNIPELLTLQDGEYHLYAFDGSQVTAIAMPDAGIRASAYVHRHEVEDYSNGFFLSFVWFEYAPRRGLIRVHDSEGFDGSRQGGVRERCDYYLKYENGSLTLELETKFVDHTWQTCDAGQEIANEEFLRRFSDLGYDRLTPCGYLYENVEEAYKNRDRVSDSKKALDDFAAGRTKALYHVWKGTDIPEKGFLMKSFANAYIDFMSVNGDGHWQYVDFDNDGEEELVLRSDEGAYLFFDVIGGTVYRVMGISGYTAGVTYVAELEGNRVIANLDQSTDRPRERGVEGYKHYTVSRYDSCGCLVDYFQSAVSYAGVDYAAKDEFTYRNQPVTLEKFEEIEGGMRQILPEDGKENQEETELGRIKTVISPNGMYNIIALDENGHVWKWKEWKTKEDAVLIPELENVVKILDTGCGSAYALTEEGDVYAWGMNRGWLIDPRKGDTDIVFPEPVKLKDLSDIVKIDAANGRALAVDREGRLFVWGLGRYKYSRPDYIPSLLEGYEERTDNVEEIYVGAGDFHYLKRKDNQIFSFLLAEHLGDDLDYFVVPNFAGEPAVSNFYQELWNGESERIFDVRVEGGTGKSLLI